MLSENSKKQLSNLPLLTSDYRPSYFFRNNHIATIYPNLMRKITGITQKRERLELDDRDFIDLDWSYSPKTSKNLCIIIHGLEGNAQRQYMMGMAKHLTTNHWDVVALNLRNCSGEVNRLYRSYNAGVTEDLDAVVKHIISEYSYDTIALCGFSLGGNIVLKYAGENRTIPKIIKCIAAVSVPCDLHDSLLAISSPGNLIYNLRFLKHLKAKLYQRQSQFPDQLKIADIKACKSLMDIDNLYTSKAHGYKDAMDYYKKCSSKQFLSNIKIPTFILNAKNDSFLGNDCYPKYEASNNTNLFLEIPKYGGHVGFHQPGAVYYHEQRIIQFYTKILDQSNKENTKPQLFL